MKGQDREGRNAKALNTKKTLEEPRKLIPQVVINTPKNFDRSRYIIPQMREEEEENGEKTETSVKSPDNARIEEIEEEDVPQERPFDRVKPVERIFQPRDYALPRKEELKENSSSKERVVSTRAEEIRKAVRPKDSLSDTDWKSVKQKAVDSIAEKILRKEVEISAEHAIKASPELQKALMRKIRNRRLPRRNANAFFKEAGTEEKLGRDILSGFSEDTEFVDIEDVEVAQTFEILEEPRGHLEEGSVVHKDAVEQYISDLPPEDRKKVIIVARVMDTLRCIFPEINGSKEEVEAVTDGGSQIVAIDMVVAVGLGLTWDPESNILMQSANGQLQRTKGLARNVPFRFGEITVYLQLHVVEEAPYQVLLGRPFDALTNSSIQNFPDGDQHIIATCPNTGVKCTIPTYPRGGGKRIRPKVREPALKSEDAVSAKSRKEYENDEKSETLNFQLALRNC